jgi:hypothetical protein
MIDSPDLFVRTASTALPSPLDALAAIPEEEMQKAAGHGDPSTTKLYDRRGYNPGKAAGFFATY